MKIRHIVTAVLALGALTACSFPMSDLKSPCAGAEGSPCVRTPVNAWWMEKGKA